jgi:hypothetical protein
MKTKLSGAGLQVSEVLEKDAKASQARKPAQKRCKDGEHCPHIRKGHITCCRCDWRSRLPADIFREDFESPAVEVSELYGSVFLTSAEISSIIHRLAELGNYKGRRAGVCNVARQIVIDLDSMVRARNKQSGKQTLVSKDALCEIGVNIHSSLNEAIDLWFAADSEDFWRAAVLIRPAVERLGAIAKENHFPE